MGALLETDQMLARCAAEIEERQAFVNGIIESSAGQDLTDEKLELVTRARDRIAAIERQMGPLMEMRQISGTSADRIRQIAQFMQGDRGPTLDVEYRSAGEYALDMWRAGLGQEDAKDRLTRWAMKPENRAASHQTTADNVGLIPTPIVGPVINFIDAARPVVGLLGPRQLPGINFSRPKVTQHTTVGVQAAEKNELVSQKMTIGKLAVTPTTIGGYVNVSRQDIDWSQPSVMDLIINDLAAQYAIMTEQTAVQAFYAGGTAGGTIPATPTGDVVAGQFWAAAASVYTAVRGAGTIFAACSPDVLTELGPLFQPVNPMNQQGEGFRAVSFGQGVAGYISGIPIVVTSGFAAAKSLMVLSTAAAEVYEDRIGSLSVVEPSVLGVQVAYAGLFADLITQATGIVKVTVT
jgi:HK97 family phage major capsid protein